MTGEARPSIRIDKWLWHARFFKTRTLAASVVAAGKVRVDGTPVSKTSRAVGSGMVLTFVKEGDVKVVRILACGERRGPAPEAQSLYEDLSPEPAPRPAAIRARSCCVTSACLRTCRSWRRRPSVPALWCCTSRFAPACCSVACSSSSMRARNLLSAFTLKSLFIR